MSQHDPQYQAFEYPDAGTQHNPPASLPPSLERHLPPVLTAQGFLALLDQLNRGYGRRMEAGESVEQIAATPVQSLAEGIDEPESPDYPFGLGPFRALDQASVPVDYEGYLPAQRSSAHPHAELYAIVAVLPQDVRKIAVQCYMLGALATAQRVGGVLCVGPAETPAEEFRANLMAEFGL